MNMELVIAEIDSEELALIEMVQKTSGHLLTAGQIAWRKQIIEDQCRGDVDLFHQEYPSCVTGETRVSTDLGILRIDECAHASTTESGPIEAWGPQPTSDLYELTTKSGRILRGTIDHPLLMKDGEWKGLGLCKDGDIVQLLSPRFADKDYEFVYHPCPGIRYSIHINEQWAAFIGYFMGDGCWYKGTMSICTDEKDQDVLSDVQQVMESIWDHPVLFRTVQTVQGRKGAVYVSCSRRWALDMLRRIGLLSTDLNGYTKRIVCVPDAIWRSPKHIIRRFLSCLWECDGSSNSVAVRFHTIYQSFARDLQLLLLGFGIPSIIRPTKKQSGSRKTYHGYELAIVGEAVELFHAQIGFVSSRKRSHIPKRSHIGRPPLKVSMLDTVQDVKAIGRGVTYDLTVKDTHVFSANGIYTHNTPEEAFIQTGLPLFRTKDMLWFRQHIRDGKRFRLEMDGRFVADSEGYVQIWQSPEAGHKYLIGADTSMGFSDEQHSRSAAEIIDLETMEQVGEYDCPSPTHVMARHLAILGRRYNDAMLVPEITASGGGGGRELLVYLLKEHHYYHIYRYKHVDHVKQDQGRMWGWETNSKTRPRMVSRAIEAVSEHAAIIHSEALLQQMQSFGENDSGRLEALAGHDDLFFAWSIAITVRSEEYIDQTQQGVKEKRQLDELQAMGIRAKADPTLQWELDWEERYQMKPGQTGQRSWLQA